MEETPYSIKYGNHFKEGGQILSVYNRSVNLIMHAYSASAKTSISKS